MGFTPHVAHLHASNPSRQNRLNLPPMEMTSPPLRPIILHQQTGRHLENHMVAKAFEQQRQHLVPHVQLNIRDYLTLIQTNLLTIMPRQSVREIAWTNSCYCHFHVKVNAKGSHKTATRTSNGHQPRFDAL